MKKEYNSSKESISENNRMKKIKEMYKDNLGELDEDSKDIIELLYRIDRSSIASFLSRYDDFMLNRFPVVTKFIEQENLAESIKFHRAQLEEAYKLMQNKNKGNVNS